VDRFSYREARLYQGELIRCQRDHDDYACSYGGVAVSDGDGMGSSTQVPVVRHAWVPVVTSGHVWH
jgi:hypothetical protein